MDLIRGLRVSIRNNDVSVSRLLRLSVSVTAVSLHILALSSSEVPVFKDILSLHNKAERHDEMWGYPFSAPK